MKRLLILLFSLAIISLFAIQRSAFATDTKRNIFLPPGEVVNKDYFAAGDNVTIAGTVNGDAYVAGGNVIVEGTINGDLLAAGGDITIRGKVAQDVRVAGGQVSITGTVGRNLTALGGNVSIPDQAKIAGSLVSGAGNLQVLAPIGKGVTAGVGQFTIGNTVQGDVLAGVGNLVLTPKAKVQGDLTYWSDQKADIQSGASITGKTQQHQPPRETRETPKKVVGALTGFALLLRLVGFLSALIIGFFLIKYFPRLSIRTADIIASDPWSSLGAGFLVLVVTPVILFLFVITLIGIPIAFVLLLIYLLFIYFSKLFVSIAIGKKVARFAGIKTGEFGRFFIGLLLFEVIRFIPVIGALTAFIVLLLGLGAQLIERKRFYAELKTKKLV